MRPPLAMHLSLRPGSQNSTICAILSPYRNLHVSPRFGKGGFSPIRPRRGFSYEGMKRTPQCAFCAHSVHRPPACPNQIAPGRHQPSTRAGAMPRPLPYSFSARRHPSRRRLPRQPAKAAAPASCAAHKRDAFESRSPPLSSLTTSCPPARAALRSLADSPRSRDAHSCRHAGGTDSVRSIARLPVKWR